MLNAGHPPPLPVRDGAVSELLIPPGLPLGLLVSTEYPVHPVTLRPDNRLLLLTDGIAEAHQRGERQFGYWRLAALLADDRELAPPELVRCITQAVIESCNGELSMTGLKGHALALIQRLVTTALDRGEVDEDVLTAVVRFDETEALVAIEPLHGALRHVCSRRLSRGGHRAAFGSAGCS